MIRLLDKLLNIRPNEWPRLRMLYAMNFVVLVGIYWGDEIIEAAFLSQVGVRFLPLLMMGNALCAILAITVYTAFADRVENDYLLMAILTIGALGIVVGLAFLQKEWIAAAYPLLYLVIQVPLRTILNVHWATYVNGFYDTRTAKRIIPVLGSAVRLAGIASGLTMPLLNKHLSPDGIIVIWLGAIVTTILLAWLMRRLLNASSRQKSENRDPSLDRAQAKHLNRWIDNIREGYHYVIQSRFLRWMAITTLMMMVLMQFVDYQTKDILSNLNSVQEISNFTGALRGWSNLIALPFQLFFLSRIIAWTGLGYATLIFPFATLATCAGLILAPGNITAATGQLDRTTFRTTLHNPMNSLLYNAVPLHVKGRTRAFISGLIVPVGSFLGGFLLLLLENTYHFPTWFFSVAAGLLALSYLVGAWIVRRQYSEALIEMLERQDFSFLLSQENMALAVPPTALSLLQERLEQPDASPEFVISMAQLIAQVGEGKAIPILEPFMQKTSNPYIRASIIDALVATDIRSQAAYQLYTAMLADPDGQVRRSALVGLERLTDQDNERFQTLILNLLHDPDLDLRVQALTALSKTRDIYSLDAAMQTLDEFLHHELPHWQAQGVHIVGKMCGTKGNEHAFSQLITYLTDPSDEVRLEAALAIESQAASAGMISPDPARAWLQDPVERIRQAAITILKQIDTPEARQTLVAALSDPSPQVSAAAVDAFIEIGSSITPLIHPLAEASDPRLAKMAAFILCRINPREHSALVRTEIDNRLSSIYSAFGQLAVLSPLAEGGNDSVLVLQNALIEQNQHLIDDVFWLLGAIHSPSDVSIIVESLHSQTHDVRANATEALEALTSPQMAELIAPLFDPELSPAQLLKLGQETWDITPSKAKQVFQKLVTHVDIWWLRALAVFALGEMGARLIPHAAEPKQQMQNRPQRRRRPPADLLGKLVEADTSKADKQDQLPVPARTDTVAGGLTLTEIKDLIRIARRDRDHQVRSAAQAAERAIEGPPTVERARKEEFLLSTIEKIIAMKKVPFFQGMTIEQLNALTNVCEEMLYENGTRIFEQGDPGGALYVVVSGRVSIERAGQRRGSVVRLATIEANAYFGEMSLFNRDSRSAAAVAIQDTLLLRLRRDPLLALLRRYPDLSVELINVLSQRLRDASDRIAQLTRSRPRELQNLYDRLG